MDGKMVRWSDEMSGSVKQASPEVHEIRKPQPCNCILNVYLQSRATGVEAAADKM